MRARSAFGSLASTASKRGLVGLCLLSGAVGCDWRDIDNDRKQAPVLSVGPPSKFGTKDDFGRIAIPISAPSATDGVLSRFLVSGSTGTGLGLVELNASGEATATSIGSSVFSGPHGTNSFPLTAIAEIPGPKPGRVLAAAKAIKDGSSVIYTLSLGATDDGAVFTFTTPTSDPYLGLGVAAANLTGAADPDYLLASPDALKVYVDGKADAPLTWPDATSAGTCPLALPDGLDPIKQPRSRPVIVGHFVKSRPELQVAMSTFGSTGKGSVSFFVVDAAAGLTCLGTITGNEPFFGQSLTTGDFNNDQETDLLVGAPPNHAYIYLGPMLTSTTGISLPADSQAIAFGAAVAAVKLASPGPDVALVGDPDAKIGEFLLAGSVALFKLSGQTPSLDRTLGAHDPGTNASYGSTIIGIPFCGTNCGGAGTPQIPVIGAGTRVLAYFNLATDARKR